MSATASVLVCRLSALGDIVLALPVVEALREAFPAARLGFLAREPDGRVLAGAGALDGLHLWKGRGHCLPEDVANTHWDLIVDLSATGRSRRLLRPLSGTRLLRAKKQSVRRFALVRLRPLGGRFVPIDRAIDRMFSAVAPLGISRGGRRPRFAVPAPSGSGPVLLAPGGGRDAKRWPVDRFAEMARRLAEGGRRLRVVGSRGEEHLLQRVAEGLPEALVEIFCGADPSRLPEIASRCPVALTNDSGILHVAEAAGVSVVAVFGPTHPRLGFAPLSPESRAIHSGIDCSPCDVHGPDRCPREHHRCMSELTVERIWVELQSRLSRERAPCR